MNTYEKNETLVVEQSTQEQPTQPTYTEKAKEYIHLFGEKIGLVSPEPNQAPVNEWNTPEQQKPFMERAKETVYQAGEYIKPATDAAKGTLYTAGEKIGLISPPSSKEFTIYSDSTRKVYIDENGQIIENKPFMERAKDSVYQASQKIGLVNPEKSFTERAKDTLYQAGQRVGLVSQESTDTPDIENERPLSTDKAKEEIIEMREKLGLAPPVETQPERGNRVALTDEERKPLSTQKAKEEILEACENLGLAKPVETKPESGKVLDDKSFIKIHLPKVSDSATARNFLPA